jgi:hypothetical protein
MVINQLEALVRSDVSDRELAIKAYKKEVFNSIRGLYARNSQLKAESDKLTKMMKEFFNIDLTTDQKVVVFESDAHELIQSMLDSEKEFLNAELLEYKKITDKSLTCLMFKYNEAEMLLLKIKEFFNGAIFDLMEKRAHA